MTFTEIAGQKLSGEQTSYLDGLFAGLRNRGLSFGDVATNPAAAPTKPDLDDLIPEERFKRELHPLDAYPLLLQHAAANQAPDKENTFRFKWQGLFYLTPNKEAYMARLRIPGGQLHSFQLRELADIADRLTSGYVQVTTRANLQMRLIQPKDTVEFVRRVQGIGLHTRGSGADNIRNLTCDPTSGVDPDELIETLPLTHALGQLILNHREFYDLPRKFNIAFHGGGKISTVEDTNDIGFKAVRVQNTGGPSAARSDTPPVGGQASSLPGPAGFQPADGSLLTDQIAEGVYFRVALGGATGHKTFARDLGVLVKPDEVLKVTAALLRVYIANGNRGDRKKARLKHLLETWTLDQYLAATEKLLGHPLLRIPVGLQVAGCKLQVGDAASAQPSTFNLQPSTAPHPHPHIGVFAQKQPGLNWIGAAVPVGQLTAKQMRRLAEIADLYGSGEIRLTVWQNFVLPNVRDAYVETAKKALLKVGFDWRQSNLKSGFIACTGSSYCKFAGADTKGHAIELMRWLDQRVTLDQPVNIHLTGCPNSCAQHYMGDIGLLGAKVKVGGETVEGYHVFVGGGFGDKQAVGRQIFTGLSFAALKPALEKILDGYLEHRRPAESFQSFTTRHDLGKLQELLGT